MDGSKLQKTNITGVKTLKTHMSQINIIYIFDYRPFIFFNNSAFLD